MPTLGIYIFQGAAKAKPRMQDSSKQGANISVEEATEFAMIVAENQSVEAAYLRVFDGTPPSPVCLKAS